MRLGISQKVTLLSSALVTLTSGLVATVFFYYMSELSIERRFGYLTEIASQVATTLKNQVDSLAKDAVLISELPVTRHVVSDASPVLRARAFDEFAGTLERWSEVSPHYFQIRILDVTGRELVRVDRRDGVVHKLPDEALQDKGDRDYFTNAVNLKEGEFYVSALDLNQEHGKIEVPHLPTLRVSAPIKDGSGKAYGVVVINLAIKEVFSELDQVTVGLGQLLILNEDGDYLMHPDATKEFGFELGERHRFVDDFPSLGYAFREKIADPSNARDEVDGHVWLTRLHPVDLGRGSMARRLWIAVQADQKVLTTYFVPLRNRLIVVALGLIALATLTSVVMAQRLARPLQGLSKAMRDFDPNAETAPTPLPESDTAEIAQLSNAFTRMREAVRETTKRLSLTNSELEQFTYAAAHDLQEPLRKITSFSQLLKEDVGEMFRQGDAADYLAALQRSAQRMRLLIDDILQLPQVGRLQTLQPTESGDALKMALDVLDAQLAEVGGSVVSPALPVVFADLTELSRVFQNLIANAIKFRDPSRSLLIEIIATPLADVWQISVRDNGIGMESRYLHKIFLAFQRLHGKDRYPGSGMGLAICRRIVEGFGGRIWVESVFGQGTVFHFTLPNVRSPDSQSGGRR